MFGIVKTTLAAAVVLGSMSLAPAFAAHRAHHHAAQVHPGFQSRDAALPSIAVPGPAEEQWFDRATQSFGGGI